MYNSAELASSLKRRTFLGLIVSGAFQTLGSPYAVGDPADNGMKFFTGRGGRFGYEATPYVLIGGISVSFDTARALADQLDNLDRQQNFRLPLRFSTNRYARRFYDKALEILFSSDFVFSAVRIKTPTNWPKNRAAWRFWRKDLEEDAFELMAGDRLAVSVLTLKHDYDADIKIYEEIQTVLPGLAFHIYDSSSKSPRLLQLSGMIAKCLNSPERLNREALIDEEYKSNLIKREMVKRTFDAFGLSHIDSEVRTSKLVLGYL